MDASTRVDTQRVGALPIVIWFLKELEVARTINELVPWEGNVPLGSVAEILIANRLLAPKPLVHVGQWAAKNGVAEYYGVSEEQLNDDLLGRALERLAKYQRTVQAALVLTAIRKFGLDVSQIHFDITTAELFGAYETTDQPAEQDEDAEENAHDEGSDGESPPPAPRPAYGRSKSKRKDLKQIQVGLNVTRDGGVPLGHLALDGNASESPTHLDNLKMLARLVPIDDLLYIADTKLDSKENLLTIQARKGKFLCGGAFTQDLQKRFLARRKKLKRVAYWPKSQDKLPAKERDQYKAYEVADQLVGEVDGKRVVLKYRQIFVWSEAKARQEKVTRERHLEKIRGELQKVEKNLNKYSLTTEETIVRRLETARGKYAEGTLFEYTLTKRRGGRFALTWRIDPQALQRREQLDGVYVLKTNLSQRRCPLADALRTYKEQSTVERRFHHLKGPLAVTPMFLKKPERIAGLLCILVWSLMILALSERQVRRELKGKPIYGMYPENRPICAPTGPRILECFSELSIVIIKQCGEVHRRLGDRTTVQRKLLNLLGIPPDLRFFKRRYGI